MFHRRHPAKFQLNKAHDFNTEAAFMNLSISNDTDFTNMVWPNFFIMNVFFALKGSKLFIIISYHCSWMLCRVVAVKSLFAFIYSADYILLLVL